jgi:hypothetical protein
MLQDILIPKKEYVQAYLVHFLDGSANGSTLAVYCPNNHQLSLDRQSLEVIPPVSVTNDRYLSPFVVEYEMGKGNGVDNGNPISSFDVDDVNIQRALDLVEGSENPTQLYLPIEMIVDMFKSGKKYNSDQDFFEGAGRTMARYLKPRSDATFRNNGAIFLREAFDYLSRVEHEMSDADVPAPTESLDKVLMC